MTVTTLRRKKDRMYGVTPGGADYLALIATGIAWQASLYRDGDWVSDIASTTDLMESPVGIAVGEDRYVVMAETTQLQVWDMDTNTVETYACPAGWLLLGAGMFGGNVYWIEVAEAWGGGPVTFTVQARLRQATDPTDLNTGGAVTTVSTHTFSDNFDWEWFDAENDVRNFALNDTAAMASRYAKDAVSAEVTTHVRFRFPLNGGTTEDSGGIADAEDELGLNCGIPGASGISVDQVSTLEDDVVAASAPLWPLESPWLMSTFSNMSTDVARTELAAFGSISGVPTLTRSAAAGPYTTPTAQFEVIDHPTDGAPIFFFIRG